MTDFAVGDRVTVMGADIHGVVEAVHIGLAGVHLDAGFKFLREVASKGKG